MRFSALVGGASDSAARIERSLLYAPFGARHPNSYIILDFFFNDTATTEIYTRPYTLSLHDALPISSLRQCGAHSHRARLAFGPHRHFHLADPFDAASQMIAAGELRDARRRPGGDQDSGLERHHVREEADVLAEAADHVAGMRAHGELAVLLDADREVLRIVDLVARHDPRPEAGEGIESFADVARVLPAPPPGIALAEVPANRVAEHVFERPVFADVARRLSDHRAQFAFEIHVLGYSRKDHGPARADDRGRGFEKKLRHQLVLGEARTVGRAHFFPHLRLVRRVVRGRGPDRGRIEERREQFHLRERHGRPGLRREARALRRRRLVREPLDHFEHGVARLQMARFHERVAYRIQLFPDHGPRETLVVMADLHRLLPRFRRQAQSSFTPEALTTCSQARVSERTSSANASTEPPMGTMPDSSRRCFAFESSITACIFELTSLTIPGFVPLGAKIPNQVVIS